MNAVRNSSNQLAGAMERIAARAAVFVAERGRATADNKVVGR